MKNFQLNNFVVFQCGGDSSYSGVILLKNIKDKTKRDIQLTCVDRDHKIAKLFGQYTNSNYEQQYDFILRENLQDYIYLPVDQFSRGNLPHKLIRTNFLGFLCDYNLLQIHNKFNCHRILNNQNTKQYLPKIINNIDEIEKLKSYVVRENLSSGSKGTKIISGIYIEEEHFYNSIVTQYIEYDKQYVIDFRNEQNLIMYPRETMYLKNGADTFVRFIPWRSEQYLKLRKFTKDILSHLCYKGIGMLQCLMKDDKIYFVQMGCRLSGASFLNYDLFNFNPFNYYFDLKDNNKEVTKQLYYSTKFRREIDFSK